MTDVEKFSFLPDFYRLKAINACEKHKQKIEIISSEIFQIMENTKSMRPSRQSVYLNDSEEFGNFYLRFAYNNYGKFGHPYLCISSISLLPETCGDGIFTGLAAILIEKCRQNKWIFSVEQPLNPDFQKHLISMGFICFNPDCFGGGIYYFMLPKEDLISNDEFFSIKNPS